MWDFIDFPLWACCSCGIPCVCVPSLCRWRFLMSYVNSFIEFALAFVAYVYAAAEVTFPAKASSFAI